MVKRNPFQIGLPFIEDTIEYRREQRDRSFLEHCLKEYPVTPEEEACLPPGCRLCRFVPLSECSNCNFGPYDHTVGWKYPTKVCLKDLTALRLWRPLGHGHGEAIEPVPSKCIL